MKLEGNNRKREAGRSEERPAARGCLDLGDVAGLRALGTVNDLELHGLAFLERAETVALNGRVVDEDVTASVSFDEPVSLGVVEPLDLTCDAHRSSSCLAGPRHYAAPENLPASVRVNPASSSTAGTKKDRIVLRP